MPGLPTGTVTFLFTDIEGSTRRWEKHAQQMKAALKRHDALLREAIEANAGYVFKTVGDAFCAAFPTPLDALSAALSAQYALRAEGWSSVGEVGPIKVRMALHTGTAEEWDGDYFGPPVNRVARLLSAGHGGQTLLSLPVYELVRDQLPEGVDLLDLGDRRLKDLLRPERVFQLVAPDLPSDFPPLHTLDTRPNNLPAQSNAFIGREKETREVFTLLRREDVRLVTLTGPGGIGKTRFGLQVAADLVDSFRDGVYFVNLTPVSDPSLVISTVAQVLDVRERAKMPLIESLKAHLREKQLLLLLDNFEHLMKSAPMVGELLKAAPELKVLVTSRELLRLAAERNYPLPPLPLPDPNQRTSLERMTQYDGVRLFIERAQAAQPDFTVNNDNAPAVAEICHRLEGLPLAIELAAARIRLLPPQAMLSRLENRLKVLTGGARDLPARQQTIRGTIEWSYDLLSEDDKKLFCRLAVFIGGRTLEAIEAVCDAEGDLEGGALDGVESLLGKSLVQEREGATGEPRFVMLETIHEYAREKLEESVEVSKIRRKHAQYFLDFAREGEKQLRSRKQQEWLERLETEHTNFRAALDWSGGDDGDIELALSICGVLWRFWAMHSHYAEARERLATLLSRSDGVPSELRAMALYALGVMTRRQGHFEEARQVYEAALDLFRQLHNKQGMAWTLNDLGLSAKNLDRYEQARAFFEESLAIKEELGDRRDAAMSRSNLAELARCQDDFARAEALYIESLDIIRSIGDTYGHSEILHGLGQVAVHRGDWEGAASLFRQSLVLQKGMGDKQTIARCLAGLAGALSAGASSKASELHAHIVATRAATLRGAAEALNTAIGTVFNPVDRKGYDRSLDLGRGILEASRWDAAWSEGQAMTLEQAVAYAMDEDYSP